ncbi:MULTISPECIES: hypothetical protein [unclassified Streptosporangium]|uniref:hypothetical protein n=1 Tax=unclassified Streptosporangium TaxID=2632669 RepID=UPI002E2BE697|nr:MULTISPECIES: hypothetical protein [unclassified Streptosporangium]
MARVRAVDGDLTRWQHDDRGYADVPVSPPLTDLLPLSIRIGAPRPHVRGKLREYLIL